MTDEVDIAQAQWRHSRPDLATELPGALLRIMRIAGLARGLTDDALAGHGLDRAGFDVLAVLVRAGEPVPPARIAGELHLTRAAVTKRLRQIEAQGLIERRPHDQDGRSVTIEPTARGRALMDPALDEVLRLETSWLAKLPAGEQAALDRGLRSLLAVLTAERG